MEPSFGNQIDRFRCSFKSRKSLVYTKFLNNLFFDMNNQRVCKNIIFHLTMKSRSLTNMYN